MTAISTYLINLMTARGTATWTGLRSLIAWGRQEKSPSSELSWLIVINKPTKKVSITPS